MEMKKGKRKAKKDSLDLKFLGYGVVFAAAIVILYSQLFLWILLSWLYNPYVNYGAVVPFICAYLVYRKRELLNMGRNDYGLILVAAAFVLFFFSSMYARAASLVLLLLGLTAFFFGFETLRKFWFEFFYLLFMFPLPPEVIEPIGLVMKQLSLNGALWLSSPFAQASIDADYIVVNGSYVLRYGMECSGLETFMAFAAFSVLFVRLFESRWLRGLLVIALSPVASIALNTVRLALLIAVAQSSGDLVMSIFHLTAGPTMVVIYGIVLILLYRGELWKKR